jgi:hypothetical protein
MRGVRSIKRARSFLKKASPRVYTTLASATRVAAGAFGYGPDARAHVIRSSPFYRSYPFRSPVAINKADVRGLVDHQLRIFYNRISKAANTSVVYSLIKLKTGEIPSSLLVKFHFTRPSDLSEQQVAALGSYFKFTFVRDPYNRILSTYLSKIARGKVVPPGLARSQPSFREFCRYLADGGLYENGHWAPQTALMLIPISAFDFIGKVENFDDDIKGVLSRLGADDSEAISVRHSSYATQAASRMNDHYDNETRDLIADLYRDDFEVFGYAP